MMPQMDAGGQERASYGRYEGNQGYAQQQYEIPSYEQAQRGGSTIDDNLVEAISQRIIQRMSQMPAGKLGKQPHERLSAGQRLALGIVSVVMLVPLSAILLTSNGGTVGGLIAFGVACLAIFLVNAVFSELITK